MTIRNQVLKDALIEFITTRCCDPTDDGMLDEHNVRVYINRRYATRSDSFMEHKFASVLERVTEARRQLEELK